MSTRESSSERRSTYYSSQSNRGTIPPTPRVTTLPFNLIWTFGYSTNKPVLNLTTHKHTYIFYVNSNVGVLYDYKFKDMRLLQGHKNHITSYAVDEKGRWLATADAGNDSAIIMWGVETCIPVFTIFNPHDEYGSRVIAVSPNAKFIASVSNGPQQTLLFWEWTYGRETADASYELGMAVGVVKNISFRPGKNEHFLITAEYNVIFIKWDGNQMHSHVPFVPPLKQTGLLVESVYLPETRLALTATIKGNIIVWSDSECSDITSSDEVSANTFNLRKCIPLVEEPITVLRAIDKIVVTGNAKGHISFYDQQLKILYWYNKSYIESLTGINFHLASPHSFSRNKSASEHGTETSDILSLGSEEEEVQQPVSFAATLEKKPFIIRDFIICTTAGQVAIVNIMRNTCDFIFDKIVSDILSLAVHPEKSHLCIGNASGKLILYNHRTKECLKSKELTSENENIACGITALQYAPLGGFYLACALENGVLYFLDTSLLTPLQKYHQKHTTSPINQVIFSEDSKYLAHKDEQMYVSVYLCDDETGATATFVGKNCSHYKQICDIMFTLDSAYSNHPRLFSLAEDRCLVEYDLSNSKSGGLEVLSVNRIEQSGVPLSMMMYPNLTEDSLIMIANDEYKYKLLSDKTKMCRQTVLGPTCGSPVSSIQMLPVNKAYSKHIYALITSQEHIGIQILPVDGNPFKSIMMLAHPEKIIQKCMTADAGYLFTVGNNASSVFMWEINKRAVDAMVHVGGEGMPPYYFLLEGGKGGWLMRQMEDFFYYSQILHQGDKLPILHKISDHIPLCELPNFMRAIGYYPTEYEIENMLHEVQHLSCVTEEKNVDKIKFCDLLKLYLNHRPALGISADKLKKAFATFAEELDEENYMMKTDDFLTALHEKGEGLDMSEIHEYLQVLLFQKCPSMTELSQSDVTATEAEQQTHKEAALKMPEVFSYTQLAEDILGVPGMSTENS